MAIPDGYQLRAPTTDDLDAVAAVVVADELNDSGESTLGADFVRAEWSRSDFEATTDAWVVTDVSGLVIAYAQITLEDPEAVGSWGVVHPQHRGRGIGAALLDRIEQRATSLEGPVALRHSVSAADHAVQVLLSGRGFAPVRHFRHLEILIAPPVETGPLPDGIVVRPPEDPDSPDSPDSLGEPGEPGEPGELSDLAAAHAVIDEALAEHFGHHSQPFDEWMREQSETPGFDPGLWLLAIADGRAVGALTASLGDDRGWIDYLGVRAGYRGRGIAGSLLRHCFATFAERGIQRVLVSVDANNVTGATAVYEREGMHTVKAWDVWERPLAA